MSENKSKYWWIAPTIAVLSFSFAIYTYNVNKSVKALSFIRNPIVSTIVNIDSLTESKFKVVDRETNNEIKENLYLQTFHLWNSGNEEVNGSDIVDSSLLIDFSENINILDFRILQEVDSFCKVKLISISENKLRVDFDFLEEDNGVTGQVIYLGDSKADWILKGKIKGIQKISNIETEQSTMSALFSPIVSSIFGVIFILIQYNYRKRFKTANGLDAFNKAGLQKVFALIFLLVVFTSIMLVWYFFFIKPTLPPWVSIF